MRGFRAARPAPGEWFRSILEQIDFAAFDLAVHRGQLGYHGRDDGNGILYGMFAALVDAPTGRMAVYYGCADTVTGMAFAKVDELVDWTRRNSLV